MKQQNRSKRYTFDAHAVAIAGRIVQPFNDVIQIQASSALPSIGGVASARVDGFRYQEILSVGSAYTQVIGRESSRAKQRQGIFETLSLSVVEKFNLLDTITCDRIVARMTSKHQQSTGQSSITPEGSHFEGLRIGNTFLDRLEVEPAFLWDEQHSTWQGLVAGLDEPTKAAPDEGAGDQDHQPASNRERYEKISLRAPNGARVPLPADARQAQVLGFSIAPVQQGNGPVGVFELAQFGTVHLGEFFCYPSARQLTMIRLELGCPVQGDVGVCDIIVDGGDVPP